MNHPNNKNNQDTQHAQFNKPRQRPEVASYAKYLIPLGLLGLGATFFASRYRVSRANEYIVKTGWLIQDMQIAKKTLQLPFQEMAYIDMTPKSYSFPLHAMSKEKMEFLLPCVFTVGPKDEVEHLQNYSRYLLFEDSENVSNIIKGIIEGETRVLAANMSIEDIFKGRSEFKTEIIHQVHSELSKLGLSVVNANIKELQDSQNSKYFQYLSQKVSADAENQAKVDISEATKIGEIGEKERQGEQRQRVMEIESKTKIYENQRAQEIAESSAQLQKKQAEYDQVIKIAQVESEKNAENRAEELQKLVEQTRQQSEIEKARAGMFAQAKVQAEVRQEEAKGQANAMKEIAGAEMFQRQREADSHLYAKQKEAEGVHALYQAQAEGLQQLIKSFGYDTKAALSYMMIEKDVYEKLAQQSANAIQGLNPKITVWNTGSSKDGKDNTYDSIHNLMKSIPPIVETIQDQTDIKFPDWMLKSTSEQSKFLENMSDDQKKVIQDTIQQYQQQNEDNKQK